MSDLPKSDDKEFWGEDAKTTQIPIKRNKAEPEHRLEWKGPYAVCTTCEYKHTIPLDRDKFDLKNGCIIRKS